MKFLLLILMFGPLCLSAPTYDPTHKLWGEWLKEHVEVKGPVSVVRYKGAKAEKLDSYASGIEAFQKSQFDSLEKNEKLAFLINAYNALTVKWILKHYPVKSIKDTGGFLSSPWKKTFFKLFGEEQSLDGIEHGMIRKMFEEPRIHFAVVCASKGCPSLKGEPYVASKLENQLEESAQLFLSDKERNYFNKEENRMYLSKIFDWYGEDFEKKSGSVQAFVAARMIPGIRDVAALKEISIKYLTYDWTLNEAN